MIQKKENNFIFLFTSILVVGLFLRLNQLGYDEHWTDEALTGFIAHTPNWLSYLRIDNTPPLYNLLVRSWCTVIACDEFGIRLPSVISGILFIYLTGIICKELFGNKIALLVILFCAISPIHIYYSQEARVYSVLMTCLLLFLYLQWKITSTNASNFQYFLLLMVTTATLYLHYFSIIIIGLSLVLYFIENLSGYRQINRKYFIVLISAVLFFVPWLFYSVFSHVTSSTELGWIAVYFSDKPIWQLPVRSLVTFIFGQQFHYNEISLFIKRTSHLQELISLQFIYVLFFAVFCCMYASSLKKAYASKVFKELQILEFTMILMASLFCLVFLSVFVRPVYVVGKYDLIAFPLFIIVMGFATSSVNNHLLNIKHIYGFLVSAFFLIYIVLMAQSIYLYKQAEPYTNVKKSVPEIIDLMKNNDGLLISSSSAVEYWHYLHISGYYRKGNECANQHKRFVCNLYPYQIEETPALLDRYYRIAQNDLVAVNLDYFLQSLGNGSDIALIIEDIRFTDNGYELDKLGMKMVNYLNQKDYSVEKIDTDLKLILLKKG